MGPLLASFAVALLWGISPVVHRYTLRHISKDAVMLFSSITYLLATVIYIAVTKGSAILKEARDGLHLAPIIATTTIFSLFVANLLYLYSIKHTHNLNVANLIMAMYPMVTLVIAAVLLKESLEPRAALGFFFVLLGLAILLYTSRR